VYGINTGYSSRTRQGLVFLLFATFMFLGALFSWAYLPDIQRKVDGHLETKNLEELGEGRERARQEGQIITIREKWKQLRSRAMRARTGEAPQTPVIPDMSASGVER
jgi:PHS family inorganic phosphate transporter-like MFS transporter